MVFNAHPAAARCAAIAVRAYNEAIYRETGIENIACIIEKPTLESFKAICQHEAVRLLLRHRRPGGGEGRDADRQARHLRRARAIRRCWWTTPAAPTRAAKAIIQGAAYDNNLLCIGEKEVFVLDTVADKLMARMAENGAVRLNASQLERLTKAAFTFKEGQGGGCAHASVNKDFIGKDAAVLAQAAGVDVPAGHAIAVRRDGRETSVRGGGADDAVPADRAREERRGRHRRVRSKPSTTTSTRASSTRTTWST